MAKAINGEGSVYLDKSSGKWVAALTISWEGGRKVKKSKHSTKTEATKALRAMRQEFDSGHLVKTGCPTLTTWLDDWLRIYVTNKEQSTYAKYEWATNRHIKPALGSKRLDQIRPMHIQEFINAKREHLTTARHIANGEGKTKRKKDPTPPRPLSMNTVKVIRAVLHAALKAAVKEGHIKRNPADDVDMPEVKPRECVEWLTPDQAEKLVHECRSGDLGELFLFILYSGCRIAEATGLRWSDLSPNYSAITVQGQLLRVKGEGLRRKEGTKSDKPRSIPLPAVASEILKGLKSERLALYGEVKATDFVFLNAEGRPVDRRLAGKKLKALCIKAEVPEVSPHKLRKTYGSMIASKHGLYAAQRLLGHEDPATTARAYAKVTVDTFRSVVDDLPAMYGATADRKL